MFDLQTRASPNLPHQDSQGTWISSACRHSGHIVRDSYFRRVTTYFRLHFRQSTQNVFVPVSLSRIGDEGRSLSAGRGSRTDKGGLVAVSLGVESERGTIRKGSNNCSTRRIASSTSILKNS